MAQESKDYSDFNLQRLSTQKLSKHIESSIASHSNIAIFGRRGTGKTEISKQQIRSAGLKEVYLNLSMLERVDLGGYPNIMGAGSKSEYVNFILPDFYRSLFEGDQKVALLLDEVDKADSSLWAPLLEITQFHSVNGKKFKNLVSCILTGNLISEGGSRPSLPLLDRAEKYLIDADADSWLKWAGTVGGIHPSVTAYIQDNPAKLVGTLESEDIYADQSPRGWERASRITNFGEANGWSVELINEKVAGCVGKKAGMEYSHYFEHYQTVLPIVNKIITTGKDYLDDYNKLEITKQIITTMIVCAKISAFLGSIADLDKSEQKQKLDSSILKNAAEFLNKVEPENVLIGVRTQIGVSNIMKFELFKHKHLGKCFDRVSNEAQGA